MGVVFLTTMAAVRRASKEFKNVATCEFMEVAFDGDNAVAWNCTMAGPGGSPYEGAAFAVSVAFPADYPFKPPTVTFSNPRQIYHPNVNEEGLICLDLLKTKYSPACSMPGFQRNPHSAASTIDRCTIAARRWQPVRERRRCLQRCCKGCLVQQLERN